MTIKEYFETLDDRKAMGLAGVIYGVEQWRKYRDDNPSFTVHQWPEEKQERFIRSFEEMWEEELKLIP